MTNVDMTGRIRRSFAAFLATLAVGIGAIAFAPATQAQSVSADGATTSAPALNTWGGVSSNFISNLPTRTAMAVVTPLGIAKTANADDIRPGLSISKMYIADYVLTSGDQSGDDRFLAQKMIRQSDDEAAETLYKKYPKAISATAKRYGLTSTTPGDSWGTSWTSATDAAVYLHKLRLTKPDSPLFFWMATADSIAADGTVQEWGTANLPGAEGTKWGWSDRGLHTVASASYGPGFTVAAFTWGNPTQQTNDVAQARTLVG